MKVLGDIPCSLNNSSSDARRPRLNIQCPAFREHVAHGYSLKASCNWLLSMSPTYGSTSGTRPSRWILKPFFIHGSDIRHLGEGGWGGGFGRNDITDHPPSEIKKMQHRQQILCVFLFMPFGGILRIPLGGILKSSNTIRLQF